MNRKYPIALSAAALAVGGAVLAPGSSGQAVTAPESLTLQMRHREAKVSFVDVPPRMKGRRSSESPGDTVVSRATLRDASGARVGSLHATFVVTGGRSPRTTEQVTGTIVLPDGQITVQGLFANSGDDTDIIPITGGSGRYEAAAGSMKATSGRRQVTFELQFAQAGA
jgi:hypothetical protein